MDNPYASPLSDPQDDDHSSAWVSQVPLVAVFLLIEGTLEVGLGLLLTVQWPFSWPGVAFIAAILSLALLKIVAGVRNRSYRNRGLGLAALGSAILTMATVFCLPTALLLTLYGFVIYLQPSVSRTFRDRAVAA